MQAIESVDCLDAGMPHGNYSEVGRCEELKNILCKKCKKMTSNCVC